MNIWKNFDVNEISILIMLIASYALIYFLPRKYKRDIALLFLFFGFTIGVVFDFTIGGGIIDFYTLNDSERYELFDFFYYLLFAPFSYLFVYLYDTFHISKKTFIVYIIAWALLGVGMQWVFTLINIIEFKKDYRVPYSFAIFLITQTITALYYENVASKRQILRRPKRNTRMDS
ncbi:hypothetical protein SAMN04487936_107160 [Halobacillus dabanensis]|uniref:Uncharacterized protein n=1 Tax=Halobacillus dabanensis TaxID=240302 RepID=A0A1I3WV24_HALDA|nr:hypothetical protein [Halobacillus dabanensis]SFK11352.1 hypothetical protein SAMN04487936_107160 [Halobacillus dabanensis]